MTGGRLEREIEVITHLRPSFLNFVSFLVNFRKLGVTIQMAYLPIKILLIQIT